MIYVIKPNPGLAGFSHYAPTTIVGVVTEWKSCIWTKQYNDFDEFELVVPYTDKMRTLMQLGYVLAKFEDDVILKGYDDGEVRLKPDLYPRWIDDSFLHDIKPLELNCDLHPMIIETVSITESRDEGKLLKVSGRGVKSVLNRRTVQNKNVMSGTIDSILNATLDTVRCAYQRLDEWEDWKAWEFVDNIELPDEENAISAVKSPSGYIGWASVKLEKRYLYIPSINDIPTVWNRHDNYRRRIAGITTDVNNSEQYIGDWIKKIAEDHNFGWTILCGIDHRYIFNDASSLNSDSFNIPRIFFIFCPYFGIDRTVENQLYELQPIIISKSNEILIKTSFTYNSRDYSNSAVIFGEGEGVNQVIESIELDHTAKGINLFEDNIDASSVTSDVIILEPQYRELIRKYGREQMADKGHMYEFECEIDPVKLSSKDYDLGDKLLVENEFGMTASARVKEIVVSEDENGRREVPTFDKWVVNES